MYFAIAGSLHRRVAHADGVDAINRHFMVEYQITDHGLSQLPRVLDRRPTVAGREALDFHDVSLLIFQRGRHLVERIFGVLAQYGLAGTETDFSLRDRLVLIKLGHRLLHGGNTRGGLLRGLLGLSGAIAGVYGVRFRFIGFGHGLANAFGSASINLSDHARVLGRELVQFIYAARNRLVLPLRIFLAGKRHQVSPETFVALILQGLVVRRWRCG